MEYTPGVSETTYDLAAFIDPESSGSRCAWGINLNESAIV